MEPASSSPLPEIHPFEFNGQMPGLSLYHYTSAAGLYGMVKNRCIWLTDLNYLNDASEGKYHIEVIRQLLEPYPNIRVNYDTLLTGLNQAYSFSLTAKGDNLSQWRGYCSNGGYCISFDVDQMNALMTNKGLSIGKCIYNIDQQKAFIKQNILPPEDRLMSGEDWSVNVRLGVVMTYSVQSYILEKLEKYNKALLLFKNEHFEDEEEWRIIPNRGIIDEAYNRRGNLYFRISANKLIPYREYQFGVKNSGEMISNFFTGTIIKDPERIIASVITAPGAYSELEVAACEQFLYHYNNGEAPVEESKIPYRPL